MEEKVGYHSVLLVLFSILGGMFGSLFANAYWRLLEQRFSIMEVYTISGFAFVVVIMALFYLAIKIKKEK